VIVAVCGVAVVALAWFLVREQTAAVQAASIFGVSSLVTALSLLASHWMVRRASRSEESLRRLAYLDELTGLGNYRWFEERLAEETWRASRYLRPLSLVVLDLDGFKKLNDRDGHQAGNQVLAKVGERISRLARASDLAARFGGDEFVVICPETTAIEAARLAERIRRVSGEELELTLSAGVASLQGGEVQLAGLVEAADEALYRAKSLGGNRVVLARQQVAEGGSRAKTSVA
jgi:diguanylate cyclase (GGDEF)-like protein